MNWLLDTNVCIAALNGRPEPVRRRFSEALLRNDFLATSAISIFELQYGAARSARPEANEIALSRFLPAIQHLVFDHEDARFAGHVRAQLRKNGTPIGPYDILIAGQALRHNLVLVTANIAEFSRVRGLRFENWAI